MNDRLSDIFDFERLEGLLRRLHAMTGLHSAVVDTRGRVRAVSGGPDVCSSVSGPGPGHGMCLPRRPESVLEHVPDQGYAVVECPYGLKQAIYPLRAGGTLLAVFCAGLFLSEPPDEALARVMSRDSGQEENACLEALRRVPVLDADEVRRAMDFCADLVDLLADKGASGSELCREQDRFQALFRSSGDPILVLDTSRGILDMNPAARKAFGMEETDRQDDQATRLHLSDRRAREFADLVYPTLETEATWRGEWPLRRMDGSRMEAEITMTALPDGSGRPTAYIAILRDATRRKRMEKERERTLAELEAIFENTLMGVAFSRGRVVQRINRRGAEIFGYTPGEVEGRHAMQLIFSREESLRAGRDYLESLATRGWHTSESRYRTRQGDEIWVRVYAKALEPDDLEKGVIWAFDDVTGRRRMEQALAASRDAAEQASQSKSIFLANMSHDIRTPLSGVLAMLQLVREEAGDAELAGDLDAALSAGRSLLTVVGDVIDLSRVESGRMEIRTRPLDPFSLCSDILAAFRPQARHKGVDLELEPGPGCCRPVLGDEGRIRQVLFNLVGNAIKFTDADRVALWVGQQPAGQDAVRLAICIEDTGPGLDESEQDRVFEAFARAGEGRDSRPGSGLGLAIVRTLVQAMRGEVHLESAPGQGTTVCFSLPLERAREAETVPGRTDDAEPRSKPEPDPGPEPAPVEPQLDRHPRILVAEDNRVNQIAVRRFLERRGYEVVCVEDGTEAVRAVEQAAGQVPDQSSEQESEPSTGFDLVLMDIQMPRMDGEEATRRIRSLDRGGDLPIVALTAYAMRGDRERFLEAGMNDYLAKPVDLDVLAETVGRWTGTRPAPEGMESP